MRVVRSEKSNSLKELLLPDQPQVALVWGVVAQVEAQPEGARPHAASVCDGDVGEHTAEVLQAARGTLEVGVAVVDAEADVMFELLQEHLAVHHACAVARCAEVLVAEAPVVLLQGDGQDVPVERICVGKNVLGEHIASCSFLTLTITLTLTQRHLELL